MEKKAIRNAYGEALVELGKNNKEIVVLDADVCSSTKSCFFGCQYPKRFFNVGVAEQNMAGIAAGLALAGKIPFINTFSFLLSMRALDQVRTSIAYPGLNVRIAGGYGGLSDSYDGPTHHAICDLNIMRGLPNMKVIIPADAPSTKMIVKESLNWEGPVFLRLSRAEVPVIFDENYSFEPGKGNLLNEGTDITIIACGIMLAKAIEATDRLKEKGISVRLIEVASIKPLDKELILESAAKTRAIVTAEEHSIIGGLGTAVAEVLAENQISKPFTRIGINDTFTETGDYDQLLNKYGLSVDHIVNKSLKLIR